MLVREDLVGVDFKGHFQRRLDMVKRSRAHREKFKAKALPERLIEFDRMYASSDTQDAFHNRKFEFYVHVFEFNPKTRLFLAEGRDDWGSSGLAGEITLRRGSPSLIKFKKVYIGPFPSDCGTETERFGEAFYSGAISTGKNPIIMAGSYLPRPNQPDDNYNGQWELRSVDK